MAAKSWQTFTANANQMKYYIIAGEASGDLHGSNLMKGIYAEDPAADIRFWGGDQMRGVFQENTAHPAAGKAGLVKHYKEGAVMGFVEVLAKAGRLLKNVNFCKQDILNWQPDVVILIDYPGFNFKIAEFAHKAGFKVFYYIAPKVWASREGRIRKLKKYIDKLYIVFPFEKAYFDHKGIDYIYKGNPLVDAVDNSQAMLETRKDFLEHAGLEDRPIIAMLAGSRKAEISTMMPVLTEFAAKMHAIPQYSNHQFLIAGAPARNTEDYKEWLNEENSQYIKILFGQTQSIIRHAEAGVINSGTASLETALFGTPQVVGYIINPLTYWLAKKIIKVKYISLGNLIVDRLAFKEFIQHDCNADALTAEIRELIEDKSRRQKMLDDYADIRNALGGTGASAAVAKSMIEELTK